MQSTSCEIQDWIKHKLDFRLVTDIRHADDNTIMAESEEELKSLFMKGKSEKLT